MERIWFIVVIFSFLFETGETFPNSAPTAACSDLIPGHTPTNLAVVNPYRIDVRLQTYQFNSVTQVTISSINGDTESFKGILLQARSVNTGNVVGTWELPTIPGITSTSCSTANDAITHADRTIKSTPATFNWIPPANDVGPVIFRVTLVKEYSVFWVALSSDIIVPFGTSLCQTRLCQNGGGCQDVPGGGIRCTCQPGYQGQYCEVPPGSISACDPNPCRNEGQCFDNGKCACLAKYFGGVCRLSAPRKEFCFLNTCQNGGLCVVDQAPGSTITREICVCPNGYDGNYCEIKAGPGLCDGVDCGDGECLEEPTTQTGYYCKCPRTHTGARCQNSVCNSYPCRNGGTCSLLDTVASGFVCLCTQHFTGPSCQTLGTSRGPCASKPCGSGTCTASSNTYSCSCPSTHSGANCQISVCSPSPCFNNGKCVLDASNIERGYVCDCPVTHTGDRCEEQVICNPDPCYNGGVCFSDPLSQIGYSCNCPPTFTGTRCQNVNHCYPNPCTNSGQCQLSSTSGTNYLCSCVGGYTGANCEIPPDIVNYCDPNPCTNFGQCQLSSSSGTNYLCTCFGGFTGVICEIPPDIVNYCDPNPCTNFGQCQLSSTSGTNYRCTCVGGYTGVICEIPPDIDVCTPSPCSYGYCFPEDNGYRCICIPGYTGLNCQVPIQTGTNMPTPPDVIITIPPIVTIPPDVTVGPLPDECTPNPCQNDGQCYGNATSPAGFSCRCADTYYGLICDVKLSVCEVLDPCENGGVCIDADYSCECDPRYRGPVCQFPVSANCSSGIDLCIYGECQDSDNGLVIYTCDCIQGASGPNCEFKDLCDPDPCGPQGTCEGYELTGGYVCDCEPGYTGDTCEEATGGGIKNFLELLFTYWPIALGILVLIITIIICWIGCHFTKEAREKKKKKKGKKKRPRRGSEDSDVELEGTYQI
ncbi:uncharacterized protein [Amphiura filiformis]|uniref:uncharacterized protein isoform X2 n=1 Tax=Amphiura filiformis TaxID=82378 RepID=UPI003B216BE2